MNKKIAIVLNVLLVIMGSIATIIALVSEPFKMQFFYYTRLSNNIAILSSIFFLYYALSNKKMPEWVFCFRFIAVMGLMLTFLAVTFILAPRISYAHYFLSPTGWAHHGTCPIVGVISLVFFEKHVIDTRVLKVMLLPTLIYIMYIIPANIFGLVEGPYFFLEVTKQPISTSVTWVVAFIIFIAAVGFGLYFVLKLADKLSGNR